MMHKLRSLLWLTLIQWPRGMYLHTKLIVMACAAVVMA